MRAKVILFIGGVAGVATSWAVYDMVLCWTEYCS